MSSASGSYLPPGLALPPLMLRHACAAGDGTTGRPVIAGNATVWNLVP